MKSLKDLSSIKQIKEDTLLGITNQPPNTCPLINTLIFNDMRSSIVYEIDILFNPEDLKLHLHALDDRVGLLYEWARDVKTIYEGIDLTTIPEDDLVLLKEYYSEVIESLDIDYTDDIQRQAKSINVMIDHWQVFHESYVTEEKELEDLNEKKSDLESELADLDVDEDGYYDKKDNLKDSIKDVNYDISQLEKSLYKTKWDFEKYVERNFEDDTDTFSSLLERLRANNDNLRRNAHSLKKGIIQFIEKDYNLTQPMDYLKKIETGRDDEISLGVIDLKNNYSTYYQISQYFYEKKLITQMQRDVMCKIKDVDSLVDMVHSLGYNTIRYYTSADHYINNPAVYFEKNFKNQLGKNYNIIPKI